MTLRDALGHAIDKLRSSDSEGDPTLRRAAKVLEDKLSRLRARQEPKMGFAVRCECGERRDADMLVCRECWRLIPGAVLISYHLGRTRGERKKARRMIRMICLNRTSQEAEAA